MQNNTGALGSRVSRLNESVFRLGPLGDPPVLSSYLVLDEKIAIIDCGPVAVIDQLLELLATCGVRTSQIDYLVLTHIHLDHAGGAARFQKHCSNSLTLIPERGFKHMIDPTVLNGSSRPILGDSIFNSWGGCEPVEKEKSASVKPHHKVDLGRLELEYIPAPGHAPHHNVISDIRDSIIFTADALGMLDNETRSLIPTTPPPSFDFVQAMKDIDMILDMGASTACLAHYSEVKPSSEFFDRVKSVYGTWAKEASRYVEKRKKAVYDKSDFEEVFHELEVNYPEYRMIPPFLFQQATRVDVGGLLNYFARITA